MPRTSIARLLVAALFCGAALVAQAPNPKGPGYGNWLPGSQKDKKGDDPNVRAVTGTIRMVDDSLVDGAVVQLKNTKSMQVRSFITKCTMARLRSSKLESVRSGLTIPLASALSS